MVIPTRSRRMVPTKSRRKEIAKGQMVLHLHTDETVRKTHHVIAVNNVYNSYLRKKKYN